MNLQDNVNHLLLGLIMSHEAAAMQCLGKTAGPDGKVERNLPMAQYAIETLQMLRDKMKGNLTEDETRMLDHAVYQLQMNYVDESKAEKEQAEKSAEPEGESPSEETAEEKPTDE